MAHRPLDPHVYDCFLSYRSARFDWVEALARNLVSQGLKVFLDRWGLIPGEDFPTQHGIDFGAATDEAGYRRAFGMLVKALAGEPPGPDPYHRGPLILPPGLAADPPMAPSQRGAIDEALLLLRSPNPVAILAQRHYPLGRIAAVLAERLGEQYGPERVVQIAPLNDPGTDGATYFAHLAAQAGLDGTVAGAGTWRQALELKHRADTWALVVRDFDQGPDGPRRALAAELRALAGGGRARIAVLGGVHLAEQIYATPELSLLCGASPVMLDDPTAMDLVHSGNRPAGLPTEIDF